MATYDLTSSIPAADKLVDGDILNCPYSGTYKQITLPKGQYKLEVWGSRGGTYNAYYGKGGYSVGTLNLNKDSVIYCYPGGYNGSNGTGFNGGGSTHNYGGGGGGGSDIRIGTDSLYARVIVAGGGGGGGYSSTAGGHGGGLSGSQGANGSATGGYGGSQTSGGTNNTQGTFGKANSNSSNGGGGGGGWYGGSSGTSAGTDSGGGGGSGYVYTSSTASNYPSGCLLNSTYYLTSASTTAGSASFTSPTGSSETGHNDNGYVRITIIKIETRLEKPYLENLLKYGDFEGEGWTNSSANTFAYDTSIKLFGTKSLKVTSKNSSKVESVFYHNTNPPQVKGHKYYVCCHIYLPTAGVTTQMQAYWPEAEPLMGSMYVDQSKVGQWQRVSVISTRNNWDSGEKRFRFDLEQFQSPNYAYLDGAMLIDLTDCYGEGNEPSKEWCDANIPFFIGMIQREVKQTYVKIRGESSFLQAPMEDLLVKINGSWKAGQIYVKSQGEWIKEDGLSTFSISGTLYKYKRGMTWADFISSDYNNGSFVLSASGYVGYNGTAVTSFADDGGFAQGKAFIRARKMYGLCLTGDTLVTMSDYSKKRLDEINLGDSILSYDWNTHKLISNKVIFTDKNENKIHIEYDVWTFDDGSIIKTVHRHEFYNVEAKKFKYMDEWNIGEHIYKIDGTTPCLISHKTIKEKVNHYKITGEKGTNYFANDLLTGDRNCPDNINYQLLEVLNE